MPHLRGCLKSLHGFLQRYPHAMVIVDFRELRTIVTSSEAALHQLKTLMSGLFKQPLRRFAKVSGDARPDGHQPACALGDLARSYNPYPSHDTSALPSS